MNFSLIIRTMKTPRSVKTKINKLIQVYGTHKAVANALFIHWTYIYKMQNGMIPGKRLYRDICNLADKAPAESGTR